MWTVNYCPFEIISALSAVMATPTSVDGRDMYMYLEQLACSLWESGQSIKTLSFKYQESVG
jgi:hypothetical protein